MRVAAGWLGGAGTLITGSGFWVDHGRGNLSLVPGYQAMPRYRRSAGSRVGRPYRERLAARRRRLRRIRPAQRGYVRVAGNYGRYTGGAGVMERKLHDLDLDDAVIASGMNVFGPLLTIAEGNGEEQRVGRKIVVTNIGWRFNINIPNTAVGTETTDTVRVMLVLDKQCNGAMAASTDILAANDWQAFNKLSNTMRFNILMDRTYTINTTAGSGRGSTDTLSYGECDMHDSFFKKCSIRIEYDSSATSGTIGSIRSNNIIALAGSRNGIAGFESKMRLRFTD